MKAPTREDVISYASNIGVSPTVAATYYAHGVTTNWTMQGGQKVRNWQSCFRLWVERMQGKPGFEIVLHDKPHGRQRNKTDREKSLLRRESIIMAGRKKHATDEQIEVVLAKHGLTW